MTRDWRRPPTWSCIWRRAASSSKDRHQPCCAETARTHASIGCKPPTATCRETPLLSPADLALVQRDTALPHLALLLDPDQMLTALERTLGRRLARPVISYLRYKPGQSCLAACRVEVEGEPVEFSAKHHRL